MHYIFKPPVNAVHKKTKPESSIILIQKQSNFRTAIAGSPNQFRNRISSYYIAAIRWQIHHKIIYINNNNNNNNANNNNE